MLVQPPAHSYRLGDPLPPIPHRTVGWPWAETKALRDWSSDVLRYPLGAVITDVVDGHPVVAQIQTHDRYGARPDLPPKPHKGTSVRALAEMGPDGHLVAVASPPAGWGESAPEVAPGSMSGESETAPNAYACAYVVRKRPRWLVASAATVVGACAGGPPGAVVGLLAGLWLNSKLPASS